MNTVYYCLKCHTPSKAAGKCWTYACKGKAVEHSAYLEHMRRHRPKFYRRLMKTLQEWDAIFGPIAAREAK